MEERSRLAIWAAAIQRLLMVRHLSGRMPLWVVTEYPKSGGSWVASMLSEILDVPFPRNCRPGWEPAVFHGHYAYHPGIRNVVVVLRDGRDVMVSAYYHYLFQNERNAPRRARKHRRLLDFDDYEDIGTNLPRFIDFLFTVEARRPFHFAWDEFVRQWSGRGVPTVRYEDLLDDAEGEMIRVVESLTGEKPDPALVRRVVERHSFDKQARRGSGEEDIQSFLRKGVAGDWRNKFSREAAEVFHHHAGETLIEAGYEPDDSWVRRRGDSSGRKDADR